MHAFHLMQEEKILGMLTTAKNIIVLTHRRPDPDAIGSAGAAAALLRNLGKKVMAFIHEPVPASFNINDVEKEFTHEWDKSFSPDVVLTLDVADYDEMLEEIAHDNMHACKDAPLINVDHHVSNKKFGTLNLIQPEKGSASKMVYDLAKKGGLNITPKIASYLLTGIIGDSGRFEYKNTTPEVMDAAADLMRSGADLYHINLQMEKLFSKEHFSFLGKLLENVQELKDGRVMWAAVPKEMLHGIDPTISGVRSYAVSMFLHAKNCDLAVMLTEHDNDEIGISLRSTHRVNCLPLAEHFGGGGHQAAAGCGIKGTINEAQQQVIVYIEEHFEHKMLLE